MSKRKEEMLNRIISGEINNSVIFWAEQELAKLKQSRERSKERAEKKKEQYNKEVLELVESLETDKDYTVSGVASTLGVSVQRASAMLNRAVEIKAMSTTATLVNGRATKVFTVSQ